MKTDNQLRSEFRSALESVTPAAPWLAHSVSKSLDTRLSTKQNDQARPQLRFSLHVVAILVLIGLVVAAVGVYLSVHPAVVPAGHGVGRVFYPTKMVTASTGWSWVEPSELWRTTDGGAHWTNVSPPSLPGRLSPYTDEAYLLDATHGWVAESSSGPVRPHVTTFRTTDGGKTWHEGASIEGQSPNLFFIDQNHGWLVLPTQGTTSAGLYSTDDAGLHWNFTSSAPWPTSVGPSKITFTSLTTGWISGGNLMVTHDGGVTWRVQPLPVTLSTGSYVGWPTFFDPQHGITWFDPQPSGPSCCPRERPDPVRLLVTSDGGSTWVARSLPGEAPLQVALDFVDANHGWTIAGTAADWSAVPSVPLPLYRTDDGGLTWVRVPTNVLWRHPEAFGETIDILDFVDQNNGFAVRRRGEVANDYTQWLKTTDGGRTWTVVVQAARTP